MQPNRRNSNEMDMSGRSTGSAASMTSYPPMMMDQQQRFAPGSPYAQGYVPSSPQQQQQQQQRFFQMQMQQRQMQQLQQMRQQNPQMQQRLPYPQQQQQQQQQPQQQQQQQQTIQQQPQQQPQRRNSHTSVSSTQSTSVPAPQPAPQCPAMPPPPQSIAKTVAAPAPKPAPKPKAKPRTVQSPHMPIDESEKLLKQCNWVDKTLWVSRQLFGGNSLNVFLGSTAQVQKVKKNRARHFSKLAKANGDDKKAAPGEEDLKKEIMNARTAKRMKTEMESGLQFCELLHGTIRSILKDMNPLFEPPPALTKDLPDPNAKKVALPRIVTSAAVAAAAMTTVVAPTAPRVAPVPAPKTNTARTAASPGNPNGSTLRRSRKKKLPPCNEPPIVLSEYDDSGKKKYTKKEQLHRITEATRFRALRRDDFVAARLSSRDLWILARVLKNYDGFDMEPAAFLKLTEPKRDQFFRQKVLLKDVEDKQEGTSSEVARNLVLPLPRSFSEAAEWGQRAKKGSRVYAMYPNTTSLYSATVVDNTTYCRQDDDIIVVEFDGDEPDATGAVPKCHIPARFVTLIPREFPASAPPSNNNNNNNNSKKRKSMDSTVSGGSAVVQSTAAAMLNGQLSGMDMLDDMNFDDALPGLEGFDDLDFDLLGGA